VESILEANDGNVSRSAEEAGIDRSSFQRLMRKHDIQSDEYRK
jgi:transcriptional regulator of acetoin/glycerol metabolism